MNITLIGMSGAGKSHVGKKLAKQMQLRFVDIDDLLEAQFEKSLQDILVSLGEAEFLKREEMIIQGLGVNDNVVIAPGGSVIYSESAMKHLKSISTIVFLDVPCETIEARIDSLSRGIVGLKDKTFAELYQERRPLYQMWADHTVSGGEPVVEIMKVLA